VFPANLSEFDRQPSFPRSCSFAAGRATHRRGPQCSSVGIPASQAQKNDEQVQTALRCQALAAPMLEDGAVQRSVMIVYRSDLDERQLRVGRAILELEWAHSYRGLHPFVLTTVQLHQIHGIWGFSKTDSLRAGLQGR